jgi:hypothetical protein
MDRHDQSEHVHDDRDEEQVPERTGDVLGLGGAAVPKSPGDPTTELDEESRTRRRARATSEDEPSAAAGTPPRSKGATGIDMGSGGSGTDVSGG